MHLIKEQAKICASRVAKKRKIVREYARLFGTREYISKFNQNQGITGA